MEDFRPLFWTLLCLLIAKLVNSASCPSDCICSGEVNITVVCCTNACHLPFVVPDLPMNTVAADLSRCNLERFPSSVVAKLPNLERLVIANLQQSTLNQSDLQNAANLRFLNLENGSLGTIDLNLSSGLTKLEELDLRGNRLTSVPWIVPSNSSELRYLNLRENKITMMLEQELKIIDTLYSFATDLEVDLTDNPFDCRCGKETMTLFEWFNKTNVNLTNRHSLTCQAPWMPDSSKIFVIFGEIMELDYKLRCFPIEWFMYTVGLFGAGLFIGITPFLVKEHCQGRWLQYKFMYLRYRIRNRLGWCKPRPTLVLKPPEPGMSGYVSVNNSENRPKVYVIYDENDENVKQFVNSTLKNTIGPKYYMFTNAYLGPGALKIDSIVSAIDISACSLVIISKGIFNNALDILGIKLTLGKSPLHPLPIIYESRNVDPTRWGEAAKEAQVVRHLIRQTTTVTWSTTDDPELIKRAKRAIKIHLYHHSNVEELDDEPYRSLQGDTCNLTASESATDHADENPTFSGDNDGNVVADPIGQTAGEERANRIEEIRNELLSCYNPLEDATVPPEENEETSGF